MRKIRKASFISEACKERFLHVDAHFRSESSLAHHGIFKAGMSTLYPPYEMSRPFPHFHLLILTSAGKGYLETPSGNYEIAPGTGLLIPSRNAHRYTVSRAPWSITWFHMKESHRWQYLEGRKISLFECSYLEDVNNVSSVLYNECRRTHLHSAKVVSSLSDVLLVYILRIVSEDHSAGGAVIRERLERLWMLVAKDLSADWNVERLSYTANVSVSHLFHIVKKWYGRSPKQQVTRLRMAKVEELLYYTDYPLKVISELVGYSTPYALSNAFVRFKGVSPGRYRKENMVGDSR